MSLKLHIVSFDVPYPPNYGGVIDVFYKIKALHHLGVKIILHTYDYGRGKQEHLNKYCEKVHYYKRSSFLSVFSRKPFIVKTRDSEALINNLNKDNFPILFEGIHTTFPLINSDFSHRKILVRTHNIEHDYYAGLAKSETSIFKKIFFNFEAKKLKFYEKIIHKVDIILTISPSEQKYFKIKFGEKSKYIPVFHQKDKITKLSEKGEYALYHGDLRVSDNLKAVTYLIDIFKTINYPLRIASSFKNEQILNEISKIKNISFVLIDSKNQDHLKTLFEKAHINTLPTFQKTGIKLKLIHALFSSRFCVVTNKMVEDTGLENLCEIAYNKSEFKEKIKNCIAKKYTEKEMINKQKKLIQFETSKNAQKIINLI